MKISLAQLNYKIGDFDKNTQKIIQAIREARSDKVDIIIFSELCVCGYPPLDLLEHKKFIDEVYKAIQEIAAECVDIAAIIGAPVLNDEPMGKNLRNAALFCASGKVQKTIFKTLLPTYDIFDEYRYFEPASAHEIIEWKGYKIALTICEDLWFEQPIMSGFGKNKLYTIDPVEKLAALKPDFIVNIAASPFAYNHDEIKREILFQSASKFKLPVFYVNQVGAHTEIIFDGGSRIVNSEGVLMHRLPFFSEAVETFRLEDILASKEKTTVYDVPGRIEKIHNALVLGIHDYFHKMNFQKAV